MVKKFFFRQNEHLEELMLMGNPCAEYEGYRSYVIAVLPQLKQLDMAEINRTERIEALQRFANSKDNIILGFKNYQKIRQKQLHDHTQNLNISPVTQIFNFKFCPLQSCYIIIIGYVFFLFFRMTKIRKNFGTKSVRTLRRQELR